MLPVDGDALKVWLEEVALPKVSDADPLALSEYIVLLLDSIDLAFLDHATKQQCVAKLHEFFETHTEPFVDELFLYISKHRQPAAAPVPTATTHHQHQPSSSASSSHRDSRRRRSHSRSRSRSPSASRSRSRSRSRSLSDDRVRRRRKGSRDEPQDEHRRRERDERDERSDRNDRGRSGRGNELVIDHYYGGSGREDGGRDRPYDERERRHVERRDYRTGSADNRWQPVHHVVTDRRSRPAHSPPLHIQRPFVPPPTHNGDHTRQPRRTVVMPASNPFTSGAAASHSTTPADNDTPAGAVRVGQHTVVKRKRPDEADNTTNTSAVPQPPASHSGAAATLLLSNAPRFILNIKLLMEHFSLFGAIQGIDIQEAAGTASVKYGTAEEVLRALTAQPIHPQARLTVLPAAQQPPTQSSHTQPAASARVQNGAAVQQRRTEEVEDEEEEVIEVQPNGSSQSHAAAPATTLSVGKRAITLKPKAAPSPPPVLPPAAEPPVPAEPPAVGSALHTAQLIRQQKQSGQQPTPPPPVSQPPTPAATSPTTASPPASTTTSALAAPPSAAEKEHQLAVRKLQLLQAQIEQQERLMQRLDVAMGAHAEGSMEFNSLYAQKLDMDLGIEETRRKWREARGRVVMLAIKSGTASAAAPAAAPATAAVDPAPAASAMTM